MKKLNSLSVFYPCYNDAKIMPYLILKTYQVLPSVAKKSEVIVVNDGSTDDSFSVLRSLRKKYPSLRIINHSKNLGYGQALISGFRKARYTWVFYTDGDGQYDPEDLSRLVKKVSDQTGVVNGYKRGRQDNVVRILVGSLYNRIMHQLYQLPIKDIDCDFRLIRRSLLTKIKLTSSSGTICLELIYKLKKAGARFREAGVHHYPRPFGVSQFFRLDHLINTFSEQLRFFKLIQKTG